MGEVVNLPDQARLEDQEFIRSLCQFAEGLLTEKQVRKKYRLAEKDWERLGSDENLIEKVEEEKLRRIRDGSTKREKSQRLIVKGPEILDSIASDSSASPRHRVDALKVLDSFCGNPAETAAAVDRFQITINIGDQSLVFDQPLAANTPRHVDGVAVDERLPVIETTKKDEDSGQPV